MSLRIQAIQRKQPTSPEERNRMAMLGNVRSFWIEGVLENSLHDAAMIDLGYESRSLEQSIIPGTLSLRTSSQETKALNG